METRLYANAQSYAVSGGWCIYCGTTGGYDLVDMYYTYDWSYASPNGPSVTNRYAKIYGSSWADTGGYAKIISLSSTSIVVRLYRSTNADFSNVYRMVFRFYAERLSFSGCSSVSFTSNRYSSNHRALSGCGSSGRYFWADYSYYSNNYIEWPYWYGGDYYDFTFSFSSITGDVSNDPNYLFISSTINWWKSVWHVTDNSKCGCYNPTVTCCSSYTCGYPDYNSCCGYNCNPCQYYYSCRWHYDYGTFLLTGGAVEAY